MVRVERHIINKKHKYYLECDRLCFASKNVYNSALYCARQHFFETGEYIGRSKMYHTIKTHHSCDVLPKKVNNYIFKQVNQEYSSFFALLKKKASGKYNKPVKIPSYKKKKIGRCIVTYEADAIGKGHHKKSGKFKLSQTNILVHSRVSRDRVRNIRIVPKTNHYVIEVVYTGKPKTYKKVEGLVGAIDIGLNNLATFVSNDGDNPLIVNGRPLKAINQYYNKLKADYGSKLTELNKKEGKQIKRKLDRLHLKRYNLITDYIHKSTYRLVNHIVSKGFSKIVIGKNVNMKQDINIGRRNNQNFTMLPIMRWIDTMKYKLEAYGVEVILQEESYTSKCSFFDNEVIKKHEVYSGKRVSRGLFRTSKGYKLNADVNAAYNILKKALPKSFDYKGDGIEGLVGRFISHAVNPVRLNFLR